jgi:predicted ATPase
MSRGAHWFVLTGAPSAGKTSTLACLGQAGYLTVAEASRAHIDEMLARGMSLGEVRGDPAEVEHAILKRMLAVEASLSTDSITFFDRALHDVSAYYALHELPPEDLLAYGYPPKAVYAHAFLLEFHELRPDYARTETVAVARRLEGLLEAAYIRAGVTVSRVPWAAPEKRVSLILEAATELVRRARSASD